MAGLVPAIHAAPLVRMNGGAWMPGTSPGMTASGREGKLP